MLTIRCCSIFLIKFALLVSELSCQTIYGDQNSTCPQQSTDCRILCLGKGACGHDVNNPDAGVYNGLTLTCPTTSNCEYCELYCSGLRSCQGATLISNDCAFVNLTFGDDGKDPGRQMIIYAPGNNGSLLVDMPQTGPDDGDDTIKDTIIYDSNSDVGTNEIIVNCRSSNDDECEDLAIHGENSNYVEVNCYTEANCNTMQIYCPTNSILKQFGQESCKLFCSNPTACWADIYVPGNAYEDDLIFDCGSSGCQSGSDGVVTAHCVDSADDATCQLLPSTTCTECIATTAPSNEPTTDATNKPTTNPSDIPSYKPSMYPSDYPSNLPSNHPSEFPSVLPSNGPTELPSLNPSKIPTNTPTTPQPSATPTNKPSNQPTVLPSLIPTNKPSLEPSNVPTTHPSAQPSNLPSVVPTNGPTQVPSAIPTNMPSNLPSKRPTDLPSLLPSNKPTQVPTAIPTRMPSNLPTKRPTDSPSVFPSDMPTKIPSAIPTKVPSELPSKFPTETPTGKPSIAPSLEPSGVPSKTPTNIPSNEPSISPTNEPTQPTVEPSVGPTNLPSETPTDRPSLEPSVIPTETPTKDQTPGPTNAPTADQKLTKKGGGDDEMDIGVVIGIVVACVVLFAICVVVGFFIMRKKQEEDKEKAIALQKVYKSKDLNHPTMTSVASTSGGDTLDPVLPGSRPITPMGPTRGGSTMTPLTPTSAISGTTPGITPGGHLTTNYSQQLVGPPGEGSEDNLGNYASNTTNDLRHIARGGFPLPSSSINVGVVTTGFIDDDDDDVIHNEEKEIEYVTPGGPDTGFQVSVGGDDDDGDDSQDSDSSEAEMNELRNQIVAQSIAHGVTPGGPSDGGVSNNYGNNNNHHNNNNNGDRRESIEMGIALAELMAEKEKQNNNVNNGQNINDNNNNNNKFGMMLSDNLMAIDAIEDEIVNQMNNDKDGNGDIMGFTPGGD